MIIDHKTWGETLTSHSIASSLSRPILLNFKCLQTIGKSIGRNKKLKRKKEKNILMIIWQSITWWFGWWDESVEKYDQNCSSVRRHGGNILVLFLLSLTTGKSKTLFVLEIHVRCYSILARDLFWSFETGFMFILYRYARTILYL